MRVKALVLLCAHCQNTIHEYYEDWHHDHNSSHYCDTNWTVIEYEAANYEGEFPATAEPYMTEIEWTP